MYRWLIIFLILVIPDQQINGQDSGSNHVRTMNFNQLEPLLHYSNDTVYLVNFWATWCAPCREELTAIEQVREKYINNKFRVILVSLDFPKQLNSQLIPFINAHHVKSEVIFLDDPNQNSWINKIDTNWSGEIPFTILYGRTFREFYPQSFNFQNLDSLIQFKLKKL